MGGLGGYKRESAIFRAPVARTVAWDHQMVIGLAKLSKEIGRHAAMLGYINAFGLYTLASALAIPLVLMVTAASRERASCWRPLRNRNRSPSTL
jgi:hypothetical protein